MCGIVGLWQAKNGPPVRRADLVAMSDSLVSRGPDDSGEWLDERGRIALGHRRLSIQDLSPSGRQPMTSANGRYVICFNGEVYNFRALRQELEQRGEGPAHYQGGSDTEVMLAAISAWGLEKAVGRFVGMFAFALWDTVTETLSLVRDRAGVKPLYYAHVEGGLLFGSELKAIVRVPAFSRQLDHGGFADYAAFGYVGEARSIFRDARKVQPGTIARFTAPNISCMAVEPYWDPVARATLALQDPLSGAAEEVEETIHEALMDAVRLRLVSDVPLGAFLSGGIDSSLVVALMTKLNAGRVKTFCVRNADADYDESGYAASVAAHLGTEHSVLEVTADDAIRELQKLPTVYDEPFADSSQLPTLLVSRFARKEVTVALSGDGGDEVFGGYNRYLWLPKLWRIAQRVPRPARGMLADFSEMLAGWLDAVPASVAARAPVRLPSDKARKLGRLFAQSSFEEAYASLCRLGIDVAGSRPASQLPRLEGMDLPMRLMLWDTLSYLPGDILTKVDRASMSASLEAREPLLDHRLMELAWRIPLEMKIKDGRGKLILRRILAKYVPPPLIERPKTGFSVPIGRWLRGPLREWARERVEQARVGGLFDRAKLGAVWRDHVDGRADAGATLWSVVVFQSWLEEYKPKA